MKKKMFVALFVIAAFAGLSYVSAMADSKKACDKKGDSCCAGLPENLKLTKEQKAKFEECSNECKKFKIKNTADIKTVRVDLDALLKKDSIDKVAVDAKVDEIAELIKKALKYKMDCKLKMLSNLDAEQKKVYLESDCCDGERHYGGEKGGKMG
ncbi:MAG: hypothetical protein HW415_858, partial [Deltaproteobacteria bacterium]|nr:hypothetical protein [Deltaproteobacteria bacterium]